VCQTWFSILTATAIALRIATTGLDPDTAISLYGVPLLAILWALLATRIPHVPSPVARFAPPAIPLFALWRVHITYGLLSHAGADTTILADGGRLTWLLLLAVAVFLPKALWPSSGRL
jgi:hypothetical protein